MLFPVGTKVKFENWTGIVTGHGLNLNTARQMYPFYVVELDTGFYSPIINGYKCWVGSLIVSGDDSLTEIK